ncbi:immunoglobulin-binding protein 1b, partial [Nephila pilipes]
NTNREMTSSDLKNGMQALKHLIGNSDCEQNDAELGILFDNCMQLRDLIENSTLSSIDNELQEAISTCIKALEKCTMMVNTLELFSCNETAEELQTASIRYLLLPAILGSLNLNVQNKNVSDRMTYVEIAELCKQVFMYELLTFICDLFAVVLVYFKDFLRRCSDYELCESSLKYFKEILNKENSNEVNSDPSSVREKKIQLFKQKRELENKEMLLKSAILRPESEECIREYYFVLLEKWILIAVDELENLKREKEILISMPKKDISTSNIQDKKNVK